MPQIKSTQSAQATHYMHSYPGVGAALKTIYHEQGVRGLFANSYVNMLRSAIGTPVNLTVYT